MKRVFTSVFWKERDMELFLGKFLRFGVTLACVITLIGGALYIYQQQGVMPDYSPTPDDMPFPGVKEYLRSFSSIWEGVLALDGAAIIQLGVIVLVATPVFRVALSAIGFLIENDYMYVVVTLIVLAIILANMLLGLH